MFPNSLDYNSIEYMIATDSLGYLDYCMIVILGLDYVSAHVGALYKRNYISWLSESCTMFYWYLNQVLLHDLSLHGLSKPCNSV